MFAAYAMDNIMQVAKALWLLCLSVNKTITLKPMGNIIAVVAVLEINALRNAVAIIKPATIREGELPILVKISVQYVYLNSSAVWQWQ